MYEDLFSLKQKTAVVTGGNGYLGSAIARGLADFGANVAVADVNPSEETAEYAKFVECDVSSTASIREMLRKTEEHYGSIDILINCAIFGSVFGHAGTVEGMTDEDFARGLDGGAGSTFRCTREAVPYLEKSGGGSIINIASMYGMVSPDPSIYGDSGANNPVAYGVGKAGVIQFTRYCAAHLANKGIRVNSISPGPFPKNKFNTNDAFMEQLSRKTMLKKIGKPRDLVGAAMLLASDASAYMTGTNIVVDGGWTAW